MARVYITLFAAITVLAATILSPVEAGAKKAIETCMQQTGTTTAQLEDFVKTGQASQQLKCMFSCSLKDLKFMTSDGTLDSNAIKSSVPSALSSLVDTCITKANPENDVCQRATVFLHCLTTAQPKFFVEFIATD